MGIEFELGLLLIIQTVLISVFSQFEIETPTWRKLIKWGAVDVLVAGAYFWIGHWAVLVLFLLLTPGTIFHFIWCRRNGIDPFHATPRKKLYHLRGWKLKE